MAEATTLQEAVVGLVHDGDSVALEGSIIQLTTPLLRAPRK